MNKKIIVIVILLIVSIIGIMLLKPYFINDEAPEVEFTIIQSYFSYRDDPDGEPGNYYEWNQKYKEGDEIYLNMLNLTFPEETKLVINKISEGDIQYDVSYLADCTKEDEPIIKQESSHFSKWLEITSCAEYGYFVFELEALN